MNFSAFDVIMRKVYCLPTISKKNRIKHNPKISVLKPRIRNIYISLYIYVIILQNHDQIDESYNTIHGLIFSGFTISLCSESKWGSISAVLMLMQY